MLARVPYSAATPTCVRDATGFSPLLTSLRRLPALACILVCAVSRAALGTPTPAICGDCHVNEFAQFSQSAHAEAIDCLACHGGNRHYLLEPSVIEAFRERLKSGDAGTEPFDHGERFLGKPTRFEVPERCGTCHSNVSRMNPYGLPTDQWAQYKTSGHGQTLYEKKDDRVAVCIDCHGVHHILKPDDPSSPVYPLNIPSTCGRCHGDARLMSSFSLSSRVVEEYKESVHGQGLLKGGDTGMPQCATCHGAHSAVPPGFRDVGHVCGRCHQQVEEQFLKSYHAKFPMFPRCVGCHTQRVDKRDHNIMRVVASPESMKATYLSVAREMPGVSPDDPAFIRAYSARRDPPIARFENVCARCHNPQRVVGHRFLFGHLDERARALGEQLYGLLRQSEIRYAQTSTRVDEVSHGVLLVTDEALMADEMRTTLVSLEPLQHTLNLEVVKPKVDELDGLGNQVNASLDKKIRNLHWRHWALIPMWAFLVVFVSALWLKYKQLKHQWVVPLDEA